MNLLFNSPLFLIGILVLFAAMIIRKSIIEKHFYKEILSINIILIFSFVMCAVFYDDIIINKIGYYIYISASIFTYLLVILFFYIITKNSFVIKSRYNEILNSLDKYQMFLFLDKHSKIIDISSSLCLKLNINKEEILGKKFRNILDDIMTIENINQKDASNLEFKKYLEIYDLCNKEHQFNINYINNKGEEDNIILDEKIIVSNKYEGRLFISNNNLIKEAESNSDIRYYALASTAYDGIVSFNFKENTLYVNDYLVDNLKLFGNKLRYDDIKYNINEQDLSDFINLINNTNRNNPTFSTYLAYKMLNGNIMYLKLNSYVIYNGLVKKELICSIKLNKDRNFSKVNDNLLDNILDEANLDIVLNNLIKTKKDIEVVTLKFMNLKKINEEYGRHFGTLVIAEYLKTLNNSFNINNLFFRITGSIFTFILDDIRSMEALTKNLNNYKLLNPSITYGHINTTLDIKMGISFVGDNIDIKEVYNDSKKALEEAIKTNKNYIFYKKMVS